MITKIVTWLSVTTAVVSMLAVAGIIIAELYVRWSVNQNFTFLGGNTLPALIVSTFVLILGLAFLHRR